jgi:hypothetical protein
MSIYYVLYSTSTVRFFDGLPIPFALRLDREQCFGGLASLAVPRSGMALV